MFYSYFCLYEYCACLRSRQLDQKTKTTFAGTVDVLSETEASKGETSIQPNEGGAHAHPQRRLRRHPRRRRRPEPRHRPLLHRLGPRSSRSVHTPTARGKGASKAPRPRALGTHAPPPSPLVQCSSRSTFSPWRLVATWSATAFL